VKKIFEIENERIFFENLSVKNGLNLNELKKIEIHHHEKSSLLTFVLFILAVVMSISTKSFYPFILPVLGYLNFKSTNTKYHIVTTFITNDRFKEVFNYTIKTVDSLDKAKEIVNEIDKSLENLGLEKIEFNFNKTTSD